MITGFLHFYCVRIKDVKPGVVVHVYNAAFQEAEAGE